jgi:hypothetical protein
MPLDTSCLIVGIIIAAAAIVALIMFIRHINNKAADAAATTSQTQNTEPQSGSAIYFPGDNVASPLETYDNQDNKEYATISGMAQKRVYNEIARRQSQDIKKQYPAVITELDKEDIIRPEPIGKPEPAPATQQTAEQTPAPASTSPVTVAAGTDTSSMSDGQKTALKMYLGAGSNDQPPAEYMYGEPQTMYETYRK